MRLKIFMSSALVIAMLIPLTSCSSGKATATTSSSEEAYVIDGYPVSVIKANSDAKDSGYPVSEYEPVVHPEVTPNASTGVVRGRLLYYGEPVVGYNVYLADIVVDDQGQETTAALKSMSSPQSALDENGEFLFYEIPPDRYALMFFNGMSAYLLLKPDQATEEAIIVEVKAGEEIDLGELDYQDLPLGDN